MICQICRNKIGHNGRINVSNTRGIVLCDVCANLWTEEEIKWRRHLPPKFRYTPSRLAVLLSIHPEHAANILSGKKKIEVRKDFPKLRPPFNVLMYVTGGVGVVGEFTCDQIVHVLDHPDVFAGHARIYRAAWADTCLTWDELIDYSNGKDLYGWHVTRPKAYDVPRPLREYLLPCEDLYGYCQGCRHGHIEYPSWVETREDLEGCSFKEYCCNYIHFPPQSWCYIRGWGKEINRD